MRSSSASYVHGVGVGRKGRSGPHHANPRKNGRAERVYGAIGSGCASEVHARGRELRHRKGLINRGVRLLADEAKDFRNAQIRSYELRMAERDHLAAGIQVLRKACHHRIGVRSNGRVMLVIILREEGMRRIRIPVQVSDRVVGKEVCCPRHFRIFRERLHHGAR